MCDVVKKVHVRYLISWWVLVITANMQSETGFPSSHQLKSYIAYKSRLKLAARALLSADAGLLVFTCHDVRLSHQQQYNITLNITLHYKSSSGDEIANVNFYAVRPEATRIRWNNAKLRHYAVQGHSRSPILIPIESSHTINTNSPPILHRFRDIAVDRSEIAILGYPSCV